MYLRLFLYSDFPEAFAKYVVEEEGERTNIYFLALSKGAQKRIKAKMDDLIREIRREAEMEVILKSPGELTAIRLDIRPYSQFFGELKHFKVDQDN